jgi:alkaline phosphatase
MKDFIIQMNLESVDFIVHLGDLKDEDGNKDERDTLGFLEEIESVFNRFSGHTYHCIGNHDLDSIHKHQFLNGICNSGIDKTHSYYSFDLKGIHFVVLDTNFDESGRDMFFREGGNWQQSYVSEKELEWLRRDLDKTVGPVIVFCHHPLFKYIVSGKNYHIANHAEVRQILEHSGKVKVVFQGHVHESSHTQINGIHYVTMDSMLESPGIKNNRYGLVEIGRNNMLIHQIGPAF